MFARNENLRLVTLSIYADEILTEGLGQGEVTEQEAKNALGELYLNSQKLQVQEFFNPHKDVSESLTLENLNTGNLWTQLRKIFCSIIQENSIFNKIIEFILDAISQIIGPLGVLIKTLVKIIIKFLIQEGVKLVCRLD